jgi:4-diphosphocytidyl-2-C-methyl-D-erythritol kinase
MVAHRAGKYGKVIIGMPMQLFTAPAKINLCLHVLGRRTNGYHDLYMLMQKVSLCDEVWIELLPDPVVQVECDGVELKQGEDNIAKRAAWAMLSYPGAGAIGKCGIGMRIVKHIPVAAGLGGGSSDAATVLLALNDLLSLNLEQSVLARIGLDLGADVPFFLGPSPARAEGIGEILTPLNYSLPECTYVLVNPGKVLSTAEVYGRVQSFSPGPPRGGDIRDITELASIFHNDLEEPALQLAPEVGIIKRELLENGAVGALMSGSGATVFGMFACPDRARKAAHQLKRNYGWWTYVVSEVS